MSLLKEITKRLLIYARPKNIASTLAMYGEKSQLHTIGVRS